MQGKWNIASWQDRSLGPVPSAKSSASRHIPNQHGNDDGCHACPTWVSTIFHPYLRNAYPFKQTSDEEQKVTDFATARCIRDPKSVPAWPTVPNWGSLGFKRPVAKICWRQSIFSEESRVLRTEAATAGRPGEMERREASAIKSTS